MRIPVLTLCVAALWSAAPTAQTRPATPHSAESGMTSKTLTVPVKDWVSCDGGWGGTISYTTTTQATTTGGDTFGPWTNTREETITNQISLQAQSTHNLSAAR